MDLCKATAQTCVERVKEAERPASRTKMLPKLIGSVSVRPADASLKRSRRASALAPLSVARRFRRKNRPTSSCIKQMVNLRLKQRRPSYRTAFRHVADIRYSWQIYANQQLGRFNAASDKPGFQ